MNVHLRMCVRVTKEIMAVWIRNSRAEVTHHYKRRRVNQFQRHSIQTHISWCMNFSRPPCHPPRNLWMMDYHRSPSQRVGESEREKERGRGRWVAKVSRYGDTVIRGEHWVKELWFDRDLGWIAEG